MASRQCSYGHWSSFGSLDVDCMFFFFFCLPRVCLMLVSVADWEVRSDALHTVHEGGLSK